MLRPTTSSTIVTGVDSTDKKKPKTLFEPRLVMLGVQNYDYTEVASGLREGEELALLSAAAMQVARNLQNEQARARMGGGSPIPGGGGEILVDRVRRKVSPLKAMSNDWLEVMDVAHRLGLFTTATMMFGHVETVEDRIEHLERLRAQQDKSLARRSQAGAELRKPFFQMKGNDHDKT